MQLRTILNRVYKLPGFVYGKIRLVEREGGQAEVEVEVLPRANGRARCSGCGEPAACYDRRERRRYQFVPVLGLPTYFIYEMRRVDCRRCGKVKVERVPWAEGKQRSTKALRWFLASWAKRLSWQETAQVFGVSWERVWRAVGMAVEWGRERVQLEGVATIGVDEIAWQKGHKYLTLVYQLDAGRRRLLWVGRERKIETLAGFFDWFGEERSGRLRVVCSDMWKAYLRVVAERAQAAVHVLDRFHIVQKLGKAIDAVRAAEAKQLKAQGEEPVLKNTRWLLLKRKENLSEKQEPKLAELVKLNLRTVRAYLLKEDFQQFWECRSPTAGDALAAGADEEGREDAEAASAAGLELVPDREELFFGCGGGHEPQSQAGYEKSVRVQILQVLRTRFISFTWKSTGAQPCPPILLKSLILGIRGSIFGSPD